MTPEDYIEWLRTAKEGGSAVYHDGFIGIDRWTLDVTTKGHLYYKADPEVGRLARAAWRSYELGLAFLTQRKVTEGVYLYIATRSWRRFPRMVGTAEFIGPAAPTAVIWDQSGHGVRNSGSDRRFVMPFNPPRLLPRSS